eukprot:scaffold6705_cov31-Tisochrysis_lutea.AAC.5
MAGHSPTKRRWVRVGGRASALPPSRSASVRSRCHFARPAASSSRAGCPMLLGFPAPSAPSATGPSGPSLGSFSSFPSCAPASQEGPLSGGRCAVGMVPTVSSCSSLSMAMSSTSPFATCRTPLRLLA